jgi:hypothetical protein
LAAVVACFSAVLQVAEKYAYKLNIARLCMGACVKLCEDSTDGVRDCKACNVQHTITEILQKQKQADDDSLFQWCAQLQATVGAPVTARDFAPQANTNSLASQNQRMIL